MPNENGQTPKGKDSRLRFRLQEGTVLERIVTTLKAEGRDKERQKLEAAICAFWAPYAHQDSESEVLQEIALQSILDLSDQILSIALLANLPVDQLNPMELKTRAVSIKQQNQNSATKARTEEPVSRTFVSQTLPSNNAKPNKATKVPIVPQERESLFED